MAERPSVAVVIPVYRSTLGEEERLSVQSAFRCLGRHEFFQLSPQSLPVNVIGRKIVRFADAFFESTSTYNRLLLSRAFYDAFVGFEFIVICQTDCLILADRLAEFMDLPIDYVGAPWVLFDRSGGVRLGRAGNGGLSLRRVPAFRAAFEARCVLRLPAEELERHFGHLRYFPRLKAGTLAVRTALRRPSSGFELARWWAANEDIFWSFVAPALMPGFRVADTAVGLRFSFEEEPRHCHSLVGGRLPLGCHAWSRYDAEFWRGQLRRATKMWVPVGRGAGDS